MSSLLKLIETFMLNACVVVLRPFAVTLSAAKHHFHSAQAELRRRTIYISLRASLTGPPSLAELGGHPDPSLPLALQDAV